MGYFPNGTAGEEYEARYCARCQHEYDAEGRGCAVWDAHLLHNYDECNKPDSILHLLIPRKGIDNERCLMFLERTA